jgi:tRNA G10  N-methylase Trm11
MKSWLHLEMAHPEPLPRPLDDDDVRYPEALVAHFLREFTRQGDAVLDPFAGFGTTLAVAERMDRIAYGVEMLPERVEYARGRLQRPENLIHGDARALAALPLPPIDFCMTSPPYMGKEDVEDPLAAYLSKGRGYRAYLSGMRKIFGQVRGKMRPAGAVVLEVANLKVEGQVTALAWDIAEEVSKVLRFEGEVVICWDRYGYGYDHSYCLVYSVL